MTYDNYYEALKNDIIEQFKDKAYIAILHEAMAKQLQDVYDFFKQLAGLLDIDSAEGANLDYIGDIVRLSREEARALAVAAGAIPASQAGELPDENYREYLKYKIFENTAAGTIEDTIKSIRMMWDGEVTYAESPDRPATILLSYDLWTGNHQALENLPIIRAAGVGVVYRLTGRLDDTLKLGGGTTEAMHLTVTGTEPVLDTALADELNNLLLDENGAVLCE